MSSSGGDVASFINVAKSPHNCRSFLSHGCSQESHSESTSNQLFSSLPYPWCSAQEGISEQMCNVCRGDQSGLCKFSHLGTTCKTYSDVHNRSLGKSVPISNAGHKRRRDNCSNRGPFVASKGITKPKINTAVSSESVTFDSFFFDFPEHLNQLHKRHAHQRRLDLQESFDHKRRRLHATPSRALSHGRPPE